jgi:radical SAM enzyme (TIGR01210 family)
VAIGLETAHEAVLRRLNKQMTLADFERAVRFLTEREVSVRAFILLRPPFLDEVESVEWALASIEFAFSVGVGCCVVIPTRGGNGIMEQLRERGDFSSPAIASMEAVLEAGIGLAGKRRVFVDLWDAGQFCPCPRCGPARVERLRSMNLAQQIVPRVSCTCEEPA